MDLSPSSDPDSSAFSDDDGVLYDEEVTPEYGILGFTLRELLIVGVWLLSFLLSFFPVSGDLPIWAIGIEWILPVGLPAVAVFLLVLRRFSPDGIRRVGSLGIDQFASVAFSVSAVVWLGTLWLAISTVIASDYWSLSWNGVAQVITSIALVALTVFAPIIPGLKEDFEGRLVTLAHRNANPVRPVIARPRPESPADESAAVAVDADPDETGVVDTASDDTTVIPESGLDRDDTDRQATDEVARIDLAEQVPLAAHASGGDTGTIRTTQGEEYVPTYSRRSGNEPEIVSDTGSIESLLGTAARAETGDLGAVGDPSTVDESSWDATPEEPTAAHGIVGDDVIDGEATSPRNAAPAAQQPFWILAGSERDVHDERGEPLFRIGPSAWALVIEDRGGAYVIRHDDGRIGYLHDLSDIQKG